MIRNDVMNSRALMMEIQALFIQDRRVKSDVNEEDKF